MTRSTCSDERGSVFSSAAELRVRIASKDVSPVEVTRTVLARAEALQSELNCFITLCGEEALSQARTAERQDMAGELLGLLHGVPVTVKDIVNTKGVRTTFGAVLFSDNVPGGMRSRSSGCAHWERS